MPRAAVGASRDGPALAPRSPRPPLRAYVSRPKPSGRPRPRSWNDGFVRSRWVTRSALAFGAGWVIFMSADLDRHSASIRFPTMPELGQPAALGIAAGRPFGYPGPRGG